MRSVNLKGNVNPMGTSILQGCQSYGSANLKGNVNPMGSVNLMGVSI